MSTLISLNGCVEPELFEFLHENFGFSQVLGVDGGTRHLLKAGIKPNMVIGDLDSIGPYLGEVFALKVPMLISYPDKDFTDGERALQLSESVPVVFIGTWGKEIDHLLGNLALLKIAYSLNKPAVAYGINETILFGRNFTLHLPVGRVISVLPTAAAVLSEKGLQWELEHVFWSEYAVPPISNVVTQPVQHISADKEFFLVVKGYWNPFSDLVV